MTAAGLNRLCAEAMARLIERIRRSAAAHVGHMRRGWNKPA